MPSIVKNDGEIDLVWPKATRQRLGEVALLNTQGGQESNKGCPQNWTIPLNWYIGEATYLVLSPIHWILVVTQ